MTDKPRPPLPKPVVFDPGRFGIAFSAGQMYEFYDLARDAALEEAAAMMDRTSRETAGAMIRELIGEPVIARDPAAPAAQEPVPSVVREALEAARNGLQWYRDRCPEAVDGSDDEADALIDRALASLDMPVAQEPVAWLIDWPDEPDLGHCLAESPTQSGRSRALIFRDAAPVAAQAPADPLDTLLPCDITVGHVTIGKGCPLHTLVYRMQALYSLANGVLKIDREAINRAMSTPPDGGKGAAP